MNKIFSFFAGALCGALVGAVTALLLTPASGDNLRADAEARWQEALREANLAMEQRRRELEMQFQQASRL
jgi:gas vesicle protein